MPVTPHGHMSFRHALFQGTHSKHLLKHRLKYNHSAVRKVPVHLKVYVQGFVLVLVDCYAVYQHSEVRVGYPALR